MTLYETETEWRAGGDSAPVVEDHVLQFYDGDASLSGAVADFLAEGDPRAVRLMIVGESRRQSIVAALGSRADAETLVFLDAHITLSMFMRRGVPDRALFRESVGRVMAAASGRDQVRARVYGELVDLLWSYGNTAAALQVEEFWNELHADHSFSLLCGHSLHDFYKASAGDLLHEVCRRHGRSNPVA